MRTSRKCEAAAPPLGTASIALFIHACSFAEKSLVPQRPGQLLNQLQERRTVLGPTRIVSMYRHGSTSPSRTCRHLQRRNRSRPTGPRPTQVITIQISQTEIYPSSINILILRAATFVVIVSGAIGALGAVTPRKIPREDSRPLARQRRASVRWRTLNNPWPVTLPSGMKPIWIILRGCVNGLNPIVTDLSCPHQ